MKLLCAIMVSLFAFSPANAQVRTGIDRLQDENFATLKQLAAKHDGKLRLAVLTNPIGLDGRQRRTIDVLRQDGEAAVPGLKVVKLFSGEHGINAAIDGTIINEDKDPASGLPIINLYGATDAQRHPSPRDLAGLDAIVIDLQDVGVRYWTFQTLMKYFLQDSVASKLDVVILDRPNPVGGVAVQGPLSTPGRESYVNPFPEPMRPGMTMGELALLFNGEGRIGAKVTVVKMTGWKRSDWYDDTGLLWVNPSPNLRSLAQATVYPGLALLEGVNVHLKGPSEPPFVRFGAPWIKATQLASYLNARAIPGVKFMPVTYVPAGDAQYKYSGQRVEGVEVIVNDRNAVDVPALGVEAVAALRKLYPDKAEIDGIDRLLLNKGVFDQIKAGTDPRTIAAGWQAELDGFKAKRQRYLLYPQACVLEFSALFGKRPMSKELYLVFTERDGPPFPSTLFARASHFAAIDMKSVAMRPIAPKRGSAKFQRPKPVIANRPSSAIQEFIRVGNSNCYYCRQREEGLCIRERHG